MNSDFSSDLGAGEEDPFADLDVDDKGLYGEGDGSGGTIDLSGILGAIGNKDIMSGLEKLFRESYKFIRLADDLHEIKSYLNDIRICFIALTVSGYVGILFYFIIMLCRRNQKRNRQGAYSDPDPEIHSMKTDRTDAYTLTAPHYHNSSTVPINYPLHSPPFRSGHRPSVMGPRQHLLSQTDQGGRAGSEGAGEKMSMVSTLENSTSDNPRIVPALVRQEPSIIREDVDEN